MSEKIINIGHGEQAVLDYDLEMITFLKNGGLISLRSTSFNYWNSVNKHISYKGSTPLSKNTNETKEIIRKIRVNSKPEIVRSVPEILLTNKGFKFIIVTLLQLRVIVHGDQCGMCSRFLLKNIRYVGVLESALCEKCFNEWHDKVTVAGKYKWEDAEDREINRAIKNICKFHKIIA